MFNACLSVKGNTLTIDIIVEGTGIQLFCSFHTAVVEESTSVTVGKVVSVFALAMSASLI